MSTACFAMYDMLMGLSSFPVFFSCLLVIGKKNKWHQSHMTGVLCVAIFRYTSTLVERFNCDRRRFLLYMSSCSNGHAKVFSYRSFPPLRQLVFFYSLSSGVCRIEFSSSTRSTSTRWCSAWTAHPLWLLCATCYMWVKNVLLCVCGSVPRFPLIFCPRGKNRCTVVRKRKWSGPGTVGSTFAGNRAFAANSHFGSPAEWSHDR